jgi:hypothetical protein
MWLRSKTCWMCVLLLGLLADSRHSSPPLAHCTCSTAPHTGCRTRTSQSSSLAPSPHRNPSPRLSSPPSQNLPQGQRRSRITLRSLATGRSPSRHSCGPRCQSRSQSQRQRGLLSCQCSRVRSVRWWSRPERCTPSSAMHSGMPLWLGKTCLCALIQRRGHRRCQSRPPLLLRLSRTEWQRLDLLWHLNLKRRSARWRTSRRLPTSGRGWTLRLIPSLCRLPLSKPKPLNHSS